MEKTNYQRPEIFVAEIAAERGFAATVEGGVDGVDREVWDE